MGTWIARTGAVRRDGKRCAVHFPAAPVERCEGCSGRCGLAIGSADGLPLDADLPEGAAVEVAASVRAFGRRAVLVFGVPVAVTVAAAVVVRSLPGADWLVAGSLLGAILAGVGLARTKAGVKLRCQRPANGRPRVVIT